MEAMTRYGANPGRSGHQMADETARQVYAVREKAAALFGVSNSEQVVFTQNCTYALNLAIKGLLRWGDHVIISDLEHNSVVRPVYALAQQGKISYTVAKTFPDDPAQTIRSFEQAITPNTRALITTHASNAFGCKLPVLELGQLARRYGVFYMVDAAQSAGIEPIDLQTMEIDYLCMPGHKGLYGPSGTGILIARDGERLLPLVEGGTGSLSAQYTQPDFMPDKLESGTLNTLGIIGLGAGIDFVAQNGTEALAKQEMDVANRFWSGVSDCKDIVLYTSKPRLESHVAVISFNIRGMLAEETAAALNEKGFAVRGGLQCAPIAHNKFGTRQGGTVRVSIGAFNTTQEADLLVQAVKEIIDHRKIV